MFIVSLIEPMECEIYSWPDLNPGSGTIIDLGAWAWVQVRSIEFGFNNAASAVVGFPLVRFRQNALVVSFVEPSAVTAIGAVTTHMFGVGLNPYALTTAYQQAPLPEMYLGQTTTVQLSVAAGDGTTQILAGSMTVVGRRTRSPIRK